MSKTLKKKKHWSTKVQECTVSWGGSGELVTVVEVRGGAELGEFPYLGHIVPEALVCHAGRFPGGGDVLLEVNGTPVSGLTNRDTLAVIRHFREPIRLKTVKPGVCPLVYNHHEHHTHLTYHTFTRTSSSHTHKPVKCVKCFMRQRQVGLVGHE